MIPIRARLLSIRAISSAAFGPRALALPTSIPFSFDGSYGRVGRHPNFRCKAMAAGNQRDHVRLVTRRHRMTRGHPRTIPQIRLSVIAGDETAETRFFLDESEAQ